MNVFYLLLIGAVVVAGNVKKCSPGEMFYDECNLCHCSEDRELASCTSQYCTPGIYDGQGNLLELKLLSGRVKKCSPGTSYYEDCNICHCNPDGEDGTCTRQYCRPGVYDDQGNLIVPELISVSVNKCSPGKVFHNACNICHCDLTGKKATCTRTLCPSEKNDYEEILKKPLRMMSRHYKYEPRRNFKLNCHTCFCKEFGTTAGYTILLCHDDPLYANES